MRPLTPYADTDQVNTPHTAVSAAQSFSNTAVSPQVRARGIGSGSFGSLASMTNWYSQNNTPGHVLPYMTATRQTNLGWGDTAERPEPPKSDPGSNWVLSKQQLA